MKLPELCEPLFLYMCRLNRAARKGGHLEYRNVRGEIQAILADIRAKAMTVPGIAGDYEQKVELALMGFVDSMIAESDLPFAAEWHENRLAYERNELAMDEKFFDLLEETLADRGEIASQRLEVLYTCLGLGFVGWYAGQPEYLRAKMNECAVLLRNVMDADEAARLSPEAYDHLDTRDLIEPPAAKLGGVFIALIGLVVVILGATLYLYFDSTAALQDALEGITTAAEKPTEETAATTGQTP